MFTLNSLKVNYFDILCVVLTIQVKVVGVGWVGVYGVGYLGIKRTPGEKAFRTEIKGEQKANIEYKCVKKLVEN